MAEKKEYSLLTVKELAEEIVRRIDTEHILGKRFPKCDFCIDESGENETLENKAMLGTGWYGIKSVDTGFDSTDLCLVTDYYGGGCANFAQIYSGIYENDAQKEIEDIIVSAMSIQEAIEDDTKLIVEWH